MSKFERLIPLFGESGLEKLSKSTVCVVGLGGVGGDACLALARSGIGSLIICDYDTVEETNINRQVVANVNSIGLYKTDVLEQMIKDINPDCNVIKLTKKVDEEIFDLQFDFLIDAIDDLPSKIDLIKKCLDLNIKFISSMGAAKKIDPSKVSVTKLSKTAYDPVAKVIRNKLRGFDFPVVSSIETPVCEELGSYMVVVNTFSLQLADYCIKYLLNKGE
ncbi:MAG: ThiF family adenylyltransferase [Bacilli bacterium]|nr:ThiF family adenylyltransferase [Bacilli bacterium]